ncbi:transposase, partial [Lutibacter sp.]
MRLTKHYQRPAHLYKDNAAYFITASICNHCKLLDDELKTQLEDILCSVYAEFGWDLQHWVVLDNHYHLLCQSNIGEDLTKIT